MKQLSDSDFAQVLRLLNRMASFTGGSAREKETYRKARLLARKLSRRTHNDK